MAADVIRDRSMVQGTVYGLQGPVVFFSYVPPSLWASVSHDDSTKVGSPPKSKEKFF